jgi:glucose-6-phosphate-specific signal transduction histidine kinase
VESLADRSAVPVWVAADFDTRLPEPVETVDDGIGGADASRGSGLRGLEDRVSAVRGSFRVETRATGEPVS